MRAHGPGGVLYTVVSGRNPWLQVAPLSVLVSHPMLFAPPLVNRPVWWVATIVEPNEKVSGSSSTWWKLVVFVYGSLLTVVTGTPLANAVVAMARTRPTAQRITAARRTVGDVRIRLTCAPLSMGRRAGSPSLLGNR